MLSFPTRLGPRPGEIIGAPSQHEQRCVYNSTHRTLTHACEKKEISHVAFHSRIMRKSTYYAGNYACIIAASLSVCVSVRHHEQLSIQPKIPTASAQSGKHFKYGVFRFVQNLLRHLHTWQRAVRPFHGVPSRRRRLQLLKSLMSG